MPQAQQELPDINLSPKTIVIVIVAAVLTSACNSLTINSRS